MYSFSLCCLKSWQRCARQSLWCFEFIVQICLLKGLKILKLISLPEFKAFVGAVRDESMGVVISLNKLFFMPGLCLNLPVCPLLCIYTTCIYRNTRWGLPCRFWTSVGVTWLNIDLPKRKENVNSLCPCFYYEAYWFPRTQRCQTVDELVKN